MLQRLFQIIFVPAKHANQRILDAEVTKANMSYLIFVFIVFTFHNILAFTYKGYSTSFVYLMTQLWCINLLYGYIRSGKNGFKCFKELTTSTYLLIWSFTFHELTFYIGVLCTFMINHWMTGLGKFKESLLFSSVATILISFVSIPQKIREVQGMEDIEELRDLILFNFKALQIIFIFCIVLSVITVKISLIHIKGDEETIRREELEKRIKTQEHVILSFSHELNNPIHTIINNLNELKDLTASNSQAQTIIQATKASVSFLSCFVNNILDISKIDRKDLELNPIPVRFKTFLDDMWSNCKTIIQSKNLRAKLNAQGSFNDDSIFVFDPHRTRQIIYNIINNAVKYTKIGEIKLNVSVQNLYQSDLLQSLQAHSHVSEMLSERPESRSLNEINDEGTMTTKYLRFEIEDTGCGIEKSKIDSVYKKQDFQEKNNTTSGIQQQSLKLGISLYLTQQIIKALDGKIMIHSTEGFGTSVVFLFPVTQFNPVYEKTKKSLIDQGLASSIKFDVNKVNQRKTALIVEDVPFNQAIVKNFLTKANIEVLDIAENGQIGVSKFRELIEKGIKVDMICMDIEMPVMNGKEATRQIRIIERWKQLQETKIFFVSGNTIKKEIDECLDKNGEIRGDAFLKKPLQQEEFQTTIQTYLQNVS